MSNYFDNQKNWSWQVDGERVLLVTDHGDHTHTLDLSKAKVGDMMDQPGKTMGETHRLTSHDYKSAEKGGKVDSIRADMNAKGKSSAHSAQSSTSGKTMGGKSSGTSGKAGKSANPGGGKSGGASGIGHGGGGGHGGISGGGHGGH